MGIPLAVGGAFALLAALFHQPTPTDAEILYLATRHLLAGENPYHAMIARGADHPLYYPLPALLILTPLAWLPLHLFRAAFVGFGAAVLTVAAQRRLALTPALISAAMFEAVAQGQWSPLMTAGLVLPWASAVWVAKPSIGAAYWIAQPRRWAIAWGVSLLGVSLALLPSWPRDWLAGLGGNHLAPVMRPGGFILLLAWMKWRTPEGRLLGGLALVPQTAALYETLPLWFCCRSKWEGYGLAVLSYGVAFLAPVWYADTGQTVPGARWPLLLLGCYLPALMLVIAPRDTAGRLRLPASRAAGTRASATAPWSRPRPR